MPYSKKRGLYSVGVPTPISPAQAKTIGRYRRGLRKNMTRSERLFLRAFAHRMHHLTNGRVRYVTQRDYLVGPGISFIVDFAFPKFKLVVEIDGSSHNGRNQKEYDRWRDQVLEEHFRTAVLRFKNEELEEHPGQCWRRLFNRLLSSPHATPSYVRYLEKLERRGKIPWTWDDVCSARIIGRDKRQSANTMRRRR